MRFHGKVVLAWDKHPILTQHINAAHALGNSRDDIVPLEPYYDDVDIKEAYIIWKQRLNPNVAIKVFSGG